MNPLYRNLHQVWDQLRSKRVQLPDMLEEVTIRNLRGIRELRVPFSYPVCVVAGPNACGKSTVLFSCACAYEVAGRKDYSPSALFPNLRSKGGEGPSDSLENASFDFHYLSGGQKLTMRWARGKSWNKSFGGRKGGEQPRRTLYLRTLANLTSPSEVRSILQIGSKAFEQEIVGADLIAFAHRVLPFRYRGLRLLHLKAKDLLFAEREDGSSSYSEFHMSAGERAILRISKDVSRLQGALILIDEIEAGLHPMTQVQVMLELQRLALRNNLQVIVTSHSLVVLESVPPEARLFLERTDDNVTLREPFKDVLQRAFYGQSREKLSILCEDEVSEGLILGVLDLLNPRLTLTPDDVTVGRNTGKDQFPSHVEALGKFKQLAGFVFVLDGDARDAGMKVKARAEAFGHSMEPLFLPGITPPEGWIFEAIERDNDGYALLLGLDGGSLRNQLRAVRQSYEGASDKLTNILKNRFVTLAEQLGHSPEQLARLVGRAEADRGEMNVFTQDLHRAILTWRQPGS
jgi:predicted ATPase